MSAAIDVLMHEHRLIERVLEALRACAAASGRGEEVDRASVGEFAEFFRNFADKCHHGKEEDRLFASMVRHGFPQEHGPIAVMLAEHTAGRAHVGALSRIGERSGPLSEEERRTLSEHAQAYYALLRAHIQKEDNVLYPMAAQMLPQEEMNRLERDFEAFERQVMGEGAHERYHELAHKLIAAFPAT
jgi:hemerythrin-like domain-containing protein